MLVVVDNEYSITSCSMHKKSNKKLHKSLKIFTIATIKFSLLKIYKIHKKVVIRTF